MPWCFGESHKEQLAWVTLVPTTKKHREPGLDQRCELRWLRGSLDTGADEGISDSINSIHLNWLRKEFTQRVFR